MVSTTASVLQFGGFTLDLDKGTLRRAAEPLLLRPKAFALLTHLARNMGRVVPKDELMDVAWPGVFVTEDSLTQSIRDIRKVLGEDMIRTVSRRGYMLAAAEPEQQADADTQPVVAVLRFRNEGGPTDEPIVDGFAEDIINGLARFRTFTVLARNSSFSFASYEPAERPDIRHRVGADFLVEGSLRRDGDHITAAVNLIDASNDTQVWGDRFEADGIGVFAVQREIVERIVARLVVKVTHAGLVRSARKQVTNMAAYELALRGLAMLRDPARIDLKQAAALFEAAIAKDPAYGLAYTYLALSIALAGEFGHTDMIELSRARELSDQGAELAPDQATARRIQSLVRAYLREHEASEHYLRLGLDLNPHDADCLEQMGYLMTMRGRPVEALGWFDRAIRIDPLNPHWYHYDRSLALYLMGDYRAAARALELATRPAPWVQTRLAACYAQMGLLDEAYRLMDIAMQTDPAFAAQDYVSRHVPFEHKADADHLTEGMLMAIRPATG